MKLQSRIRDYHVHFEPSADFVDDLAALPVKTIIVDENVWAAHRDTTLSALDASEVIVLPIAEELKTLESVAGIYDALMERAAKRNMTLVSIGGGITQDITGFAASTIYRGVDWVFAPTTLLAQADSCIGSKTSLNYRHYKNLVGTFYPPSRVHIHAPFLSTLSDPDYFSGLGEVVKLHIMGGREATERLVARRDAVFGRHPAETLDAVRDSLLIKQSYIEGDEFDTGRRNLLNFGHCFGHAMESATDFAVPHGQAVVAGMIIAGMIAVERGVLSAEFESQLYRTLLAPSLVTEPDYDALELSAVVEAMKQDKKRTGAGLALVMVGDEYEMTKVTDVTAEEALRALGDFVDRRRADARTLGGAS